MADYESDSSQGSLPIKDFNFENDDFDDWVTRFETAVSLAEGIDDEAELKGYCKKWLPLKLDDTARSISASVDMKTDWTSIKKELSELFVDPQEKYNWFAGRDPIVWDGKESFHSLATRIKKKVDKYSLGGDKEKEYFMWFRLAVTSEFRKAIDIGCGDNWNLSEAMKIAGRLRLAEEDAAADVRIKTNDKSGAFSGAAMSDHHPKASRSRGPSTDRDKFKHHGKAEHGSLQWYRQGSPRREHHCYDRYHGYGEQDQARYDDDRRGGYGYSSRRPGWRDYDQEYGEERRSRDRDEPWYPDDSYRTRPHSPDDDDHYWGYKDHRSQEKTIPSTKRRDRSKSPRGRKQADLSMLDAQVDFLAKKLAQKSLTQGKRLN